MSPPPSPPALRRYIPVLRFIISRRELRLVCRPAGGLFIFWRRRGGGTGGGERATDELIASVGRRPPSEPELEREGCMQMK